MITGVQELANEIVCLLVGKIRTLTQDRTAKITEKTFLISLLLSHDFFLLVSRDLDAALSDKKVSKNKKVAQRKIEKEERERDRKRERDQM